MRQPSSRGVRVRTLDRPGKLVPSSATRLRSRMVRLAPGQIMEWHSTKAREELLIVLVGRVTLELKDGAPKQLREGRCAFVPSRTMHRVVNRTRAAAVYIYCTG